MEAPSVSRAVAAVSLGWCVHVRGIHEEVLHVCPTCASASRTCASHRRPLDLLTESPAGGARPSRRRLVAERPPPTVR